MNNIIYGQYNSIDYPLKTFFYDDLPKNIINTIFKLNFNGTAVFRGGIAFVFLLNENNYILKDLDMIALKKSKQEIINILKDSHIIFVNKNTFGEEVITAFWLCDTEYYKLDVLLCDKLPLICIYKYKNKYVNTVTISYLLKNRIEKIAEKRQRCHDNQKTLNHYVVAKKISNFLKNNCDKLYYDDAIAIKNKLHGVREVLLELLERSEVDEFIDTQLSLIGNHKSENTPLSIKKSW